MSGPLTYIVKNHSTRLGPDLTPHVVFYSGCDAEGGYRVENSPTGIDCRLAEEEKTN